MCGIVGILGIENDAAERLLEGLRRLEYRGYDSAGICTVHDGEFDRRRAPGKLKNLAAAAGRGAVAGPRRDRAHPLGHPRRADRGQCPPAHRRRCRAGPQRHHRELQAAARHADRRGPRVHEPDRYRGRRPSDVARDRGGEGAARGAGGGAPPASRRVRAGGDGAYPSRSAARRAARCAADGRLRRRRKLSGSDEHALAGLASRIAYLEEGDWVAITREAVEVYDKDNQLVERRIVPPASPPR